MKHEEIIRLAVKHFGAEHQKAKAIEEMSELVVELVREKDNRTTDDKIITEIADVLIIAAQLCEIYGWEKVGAEVERKLRRLSKRIPR